MTSAGGNPYSEPIKRRIQKQAQPLEATDPWAPVDVPPGRYLHGRIGPLNLWVFPDREEWYAAATRIPEDPRDERIRIELVAEGPRDIDWQRWVAGETGSLACFTPMMPDRPIVVRSGTPLQMIPGSTAHYYIAIPIWIRLTVGHPRPADLWQGPSQILSNTWFGDPASGELGYALRTGLHSAPVGEDFLPYTVVCPLTIHNVSSSILEFQRLCVHVEYLDIFQGDTYLWANGVQVSFKGDEQFSQIEIEEKPPGIDRPARLLSQARRKVERNLIRKSFSMLKLFSGL